MQTEREILAEAAKYFYKCEIVEGTPAEIEYYQNYFNKYPTAGNYEEFYKRVLAKHYSVLFTNWSYETPTTFYSLDELSQAIQEQKELEEIFN